MVIVIRQEALDGRKWISAMYAKVLAAPERGHKEKWLAS